MGEEFSCPNCGSDVEIDDVTCPSCGYNFRESTSFSTLGADSGRVSTSPRRSSSDGVRRGSGGSCLGRIILWTVIIGVGILALVELLNMPFVDGGEPCWSPDGHHLAFVRDGEIYIIDREGDNERFLTAGRFPDWSPDGTQIAFHDPSDGDNDIFVINADGSERRKLTENDQHDEFPRWTGDGERIVYAHSPVGHGEIHWIDVATGTDELISYGTPPLDISPDGLMLAYNEDGVLVVELLSSEYGPNALSAHERERQGIPEPDWPLNTDNEWELRRRFRFPGKSWLRWAEDSDTIVYVRSDTVYVADGYEAHGLDFFDDPIGSLENVEQGAQPFLERDGETVSLVSSSFLGIFSGIYRVEDDDYEYNTSGYDWGGEDEPVDLNVDYNAGGR